MNTMKHNNTGYRKGCRCEACTEAHRIAEKRWELKKLRAGSLRTAPEEGAAVRDRILMLRELGHTDKTIAKAAGITAQTIYNIRTQRTPTPTRETAAAVLRVPVWRPSIDALNTTDRVDGRGIQRRLQALAHNGWTVCDVARLAGIGAARLTTIRTQGTPVTVAKHKQVDAVFQQLKNQHAPETPHATAARGLAERKGWPRWADWDDIDRDEAPQPTTRPRGGQGIDPEDLRHLVESGASTERIAETFGVTWGAVLLAAKGRGDAELHRTLIRRRETEAITRRDYWVAA